jgi:TolA-binding protein
MSNFNQNKIAIDKNELQKIYKRQLDLVNANIELTRDIEYRDYRIMKLEKELREMQSKFNEISKIKTTEYKEQKELKMTYEEVNIYG